MSFEEEVEQIRRLNEKIPKQLDVCISLLEAELSKLERESFYLRLVLVVLIVILVITWFIMWFIMV